MALSNFGADKTVKTYLYNELLSSIEEELYQRMNPKFYKTQIGGYNNKTMTYNSNGQMMPGKFDVVRNSFHLSLYDAIKSTRERQILFCK